MSRTSAARERLLTLYCAGAPVEELEAAQRAYDDAAIAEGVRAVADSLLPLSDWQRDRLAVLFAPSVTSAPTTKRRGRRRRTTRGDGGIAR